VVTIVFGIWFIIYKPSCTHYVANALFCLPHNTKPQGVPNQMVDAPLFSIQPFWMFNVKSYLHVRVFLENYPLGCKRKISLNALWFTLLEINLHYLGQHMVLWCCLDPYEITVVLIRPHKGVGKGHFSIDITIKKILDVRYWWPTIYKDPLHFENHVTNVKKQAIWHSQAWPN
jgi:hypothetical protein